MSSNSNLTFGPCRRPSGQNRLTAEAARDSVGKSIGLIRCLQFVENTRSFAEDRVPFRHGALGAQELDPTSDVSASEREERRISYSSIAGMLFCKAVPQSQFDDQIPYD